VNDPNDQKKRLLEVATNLFSSKGFEGTSIRDIARDAGMSISNIYHYFGNKEGLLSVILINNSEQLLFALRQVLHREKEPLTRFKTLLITHLQLSGEYSKETKIFSLSEDHFSPEGKMLNRRIQREVLDIYIKELKTLRKMDIIHYKSVTVAAFNVLSVVNWFPRWYLQDGKLSLKEVINEILNFVMHGILGTKVTESKH
jgi:AcrR family transcriptional regulator